MDISRNKQALKTYCQAFHTPSVSNALGAIDVFFASNAVINVVHPFNEMSDPQEYKERFLTPLQESFGFLSRHEYIAIGGNYNGGEWLACTGYYSGNFINPWLGIKPTGALANIRFAEFHRMEAGSAVESYVFLDIPALMMAAGVWPIKDTVAVHKATPVTFRAPLMQMALSGITQIKNALTLPCSILKRCC